MGDVTCTLEAGGPAGLQADSASSDAVAKLNTLKVRLVLRFALMF